MPQQRNFLKATKSLSRELAALTLSISPMEQGKRRLIMSTSPRLNEKGGGLGFTQIIEANASRVVYRAPARRAAQRV